MERRKFLKGAAVTGAAAATSTLAAPAIAQGVKDMVIVSTWPRDFPGLGLSAQRLAARITELSDGKIKTQYFAAGERVGAFDSFDEVAGGNAQAYIAADYYWKGKHPGWAYFTTVPFGMTTVEWNAWIKFMGGQELWDELAGGFGRARDRVDGRFGHAAFHGEDGEAVPAEDTLGVALGEIPMTIGQTGQFKHDKPSWTQRRSRT